MTFLATECPVPLHCIDPKVDYQIAPQPVIEWWTAILLIAGLMAIALGLNYLRRRI
jgi:hypothetical protein